MFVRLKCVTLCQEDYPHKLGDKFGNENILPINNTALSPTSATPINDTKQVQIKTFKLDQQYVNINPPSLAINYIISLQGIFPSRN